MLENNTFTSRERAELSPGEMRRLKKAILGYGNFVSTYKKADIAQQTLRNLIHRGYGEPTTIEKIRKFLEQQK